MNYINTVFKLKAETSGYPGRVRRPEDEDRYVELYWQCEGIRLDRECIKFNAAKRGLAKLCINSMWGKLTERNDRTMTKIITEPKEVYGFLATPGIEVTNLIFASDDVVWLSWKHRAEGLAKQEKKKTVCKVGGITLNYNYLILNVSRT